MSIREAFVARFGEHDARVMEEAAEEHRAQYADGKAVGSDPFKAAIVICVGNECFTRFADYHGFAASGDEIKQWVKDHADFASFDGEPDYIAVFTGAYDEYMPERENER